MCGQKIAFQIVLEAAPDARPNDLDGHLSRLGFARIDAGFMHLSNRRGSNRPVELDEELFDGQAE